MKKTVLIFILFTGIISGQEKAVTASGKNVILNSDNTWKLDDVQSFGLRPEYFKSDSKDVVVGLFSKVEISIKNGENKEVKVFFDFISTNDQYSQISLDKVEKMIDYSRSYILLNLKNKYSFIPRKVGISYSDTRRAWVIIWEYSATNSYGGETDGKQILLYDDNIKRIEI